MTTAQIDHELSANTTLRNLTRYGRNDRDSVITTPRFVSVNTSTDINRQLQSRDMVDSIAANQTSLDRPIRNRDAGSCRQRRRRSITGVVRKFRPQRTDGAHGGPLRARLDAALPRADLPDRRQHGWHSGLGGDSTRSIRCG